MSLQTTDQDAEDLLLRILQDSSPLSFSEITRDRGTVHVEAVRRAIWALVESGKLAFTPDRRIQLSQGPVEL